MAKWGSFDFGEMEQLANTFKTALDQRTIERWIRELLLEMAYRADRKIKKRTPVGFYGEKQVVIKRGKNKGKTRTVKVKGSHGHTGGNLRRNWQVGNVVRKGNAFEVEIYNNTEYASFVEHGHRAGKNSTRWVEGRFMMTISLKEIERQLPGFIERKQIQLLEQLMNGRKG